MQAPSAPSARCCPTLPNVSRVERAARARHPTAFERAAENDENVNTSSRGRRGGKRSPGGRAALGAAARAVPRMNANPGDFAHRTFRTWSRASLGDLRRAIERRRKALGG